jgi:arylsulfatase A
MFVGKWHLGSFQEGDKRYATPGGFGFDYWLANEGNFPRDPETLVRNGEPVGKLTGSQATITAQECINWLTGDNRDPTKPFCIFLWLNESHAPVTPSAEWCAKYDNDEVRTAAESVPLGGPGVKRTSEIERVPTYYGCVAEMDHEIGRLLKTLDELTLRENTFVMFTSDNGPEHRRKDSWGSPGELRGAKGHMHEGGHRVPGIIRWPGKVKPGTVSDVTINGTDILPTFCDLGKAVITTEATIDGGSIIPLLQGGSQVDRPEPLFWWMYHSRGEKQAALRDGDWKIIAAQTVLDDDNNKITGKNMNVIKKAKLIDFELFNLKADRSEANDVSSKYPERFEEMKKKLIDQFKEIQTEGRDWPTWGMKKKKSNQKKQVLVQ